MTIPPLVGMVHLAPLPGSPRYAGDMASVVDRARRDAELLAVAGFDGLMVENFGDAPFFADRVPAETVAAMTRCVGAVAATTDLPVGVNVLRNDGLSAIAVAAAVGGGFIRVNVLTGIMHTDQGTLTGRAAEIARLRAVIAPTVGVLADVFVKHAVPPTGLTVEQAASDTWERGGADALVVSGSGTGRPVDLDRLAAVRAAVPDAPIVIGSGATDQTVHGLSGLADALIVGSAVKHHGRADEPVDPDRASRFVNAARAAGFGA
jgi:uncharacterized protein